jgi:hypothetical protein
MFPYGIPAGGILVVFTDDALAGRLDTDKVGRMGMGISTGQDPGTGTYRAAQLEALSEGGPFRLWRIRAHCQGYTSHLLVKMYEPSL